jgi:hypothetical protein
MRKEDERERRQCNRQVVGGDHPRDAGDRRVEPSVQLGQREDDDRRVREGDRDGCGDRCALQRQAPERSISSMR